MTRSRGAPSAVAPEVGHQRVVGVQHERRAPGARGDQRAPVVGELLQLAVAVELVAEEVAEQHGVGGEVLDDARAATPRRPRTARSPARRRRRSARAARSRRRPACSRPARLCTGVSAAPRARIAAIMPAVVVLPLVALTTTEPRSRLPRQARDRPRLHAQQQLAGQARAAAAAARARQRPAARASADLRRSGRAQARGAITLSPPRTSRTVAGSVVSGSPSAYTSKGRSAAISTSRARCTLTVVLLDVRALEHLRQVSRGTAASRPVSTHDHLEQAVGGVGARRHLHAAAVVAGVRGRDRVALEALLAAVEAHGEARRLPRQQRADRRHTRRRGCRARAAPRSRSGSPRSRSPWTRCTRTGLPFASPRSSALRTPSSSTRVAPGDVLGDAERAREVVAAARRAGRPSGVESRSAPASVPTSPSPPSATTTSPRPAASRAAWVAWAMSRVSTTRCSAPAASSSLLQARAARAAACRPRRRGSSGSRNGGRRSWAPRKVVGPGPGRPRGDRLEAVALEARARASRPG